MKIDPKHLIAANDNAPKDQEAGRQATQLALPLELPPGKKARPENVTDGVAQDGKPAKSARRRSKPAAKPAPIAAPIAAAEPAPAAPATTPSDPAIAPAPAPLEPPATEVISFNAERIAREPRMVQINQMLDQTFMLNQSCLKLVQIGGETPQEEDSNFRNWGLCSATFTRLLSTLHKHHGFLDPEA